MFFDISMTLLGQNTFLTDLKIQFRNMFLSFLSAWHGMLPSFPHCKF